MLKLSTTQRHPIESKGFKVTRDALFQHLEAWLANYCTEHMRQKLVA